MLDIEHGGMNEVLADANATKWSLTQKAGNLRLTTSGVTNDLQWRVKRLHIAVAFSFREDK